MLVKKKVFWIIWLLFTLMLSAYFLIPLIKQENQGMFLIGETTHGHHQIEMACDACHTKPFGGKEVLQDACVSCHAEELKAVSDSHPKSKFTDPRNADRVALLDARYCVTCHREHREEITHEMGLSLPEDYCFICHKDIAEDRPSHAGMAFDSCASAGCHNYHDNQALYEDFLIKHAGGEAIKAHSQRPTLNAFELLNAKKGYKALSIEDLLATEKTYDGDILQAWQASNHARSEVGCSDCHQQEQEPWNDHPAVATCESCHEFQAETFFLGKHGMRLNADLGNMTPAMAKVEMKADAAHKELSCTSCHDSHQPDLSKAATESCMGCHDSEHVRNFPSSPHALSTDVSCATCHMPREQKVEQGLKIFRVNHNQNMNLKPNEKMIRSVCMDCHSLEFSIDALADEKLLENNFSGKPEVHIRSVDMAIERDKSKSNKDSLYH